MPQSLYVPIAILLTLVASGCRRETVDEDMAAATETTATTATETSGTLSATTTGSTGGSVSSMSPADKEFVIQAVYAGMAEVLFSELALASSQSAGVREFAQRMVADHGRNNAEMKEIVVVKGLVLPTGLDQDRQQVLDRLRSQRGAQFDRAYTAQMVLDHEKVVASFESAERTLQDPDVKGWVTRTLPALREHLQHARTLHGAVR